MNGRCCLCTSLVFVFHLGLDRVVSPEQNTAISGKRVELGIQFQLRGIILHVSLKFNENIFFNTYMIVLSQGRMLKNFNFFTGSTEQFNQNFLKQMFSKLV